MEVSPFLKLYKIWPSTKTNVCLEITFPSLVDDVIIDMLKGAHTKAIWDFVVKPDLCSSIDLGRLILERTTRVTPALANVEALGNQ